ncbi:hypothetical protein [Pseudoclavibacter sp. VKM Ac-2867]|uniref:hypothetical protein n=1 Tax=Pseudoclavibacter sp. VKM Ac-2867 TaxID=2783829 RepID=UPI00188B2BA9|nr:hypothetical protein [Pseudoclavibacter sp. VKM Ac-2867]MBF4459511.1 hypothetical protein [Pseudoclavibacter sp. VKM Ac-2867]
MMSEVMALVVVAFGSAAVSALIVVIVIGIATSAWSRPAQKPVRTPGVARARGVSAPPKPDTTGLHLLDLD